MTAALVVAARLYDCDDTERGPCEQSSRPPETWCCPCVARALAREVKRLNAEVAEHAIGRSIDEGDALVLALANALDAAHSPHGVPGRGPATCCDGSVCALLERARRWGR